MTFKGVRTAAAMALLLILPSGAFAQTYLFPVGPATRAETDIVLADAVAVAKNEMTQRQGISPDGFGEYRIKANCATLENGEKAWVVMLDELNCGADALVTISSTDATVLAYQASDTEITLDLLDQWTTKKGPMQTWALEDRALFNWLFGLADQYVIPGEEHISRETARDIALSAIPQPLPSPEFSYGFHVFSYTDGRPDQTVWMVTILENGQEKYLVHVSAVDGAVVDVFPLGKNG